MKSQKISTQFFVNYLIIFFLILTLVLTTFLLHNTYTSIVENDLIIDVDKLIDDFYNYDLKTAAKNQKFTSDDYIEVVNEDYEIIDIYNSPKNIGYKYTHKELNKQVYSNNYYEYYLFYIEDTDNFILLHMNPIEQYTEVILLFIVFFIVVFFVSLIVYAKVSSEKIVIPIKKLVNGIEKISKGDYDSKIEFNATNELDLLKNSINQMSVKIKNEINLREKSEDNRKKLILNISHDVKTPLTNIIGYSQTLINEKDLSMDDLQSSIKIINTNGLLANKLINELFELSKLEMNEEMFSTENTDICELLRKKLIEYVSEFEDKNITYNFNIPSENITLNLNVIKFERAIDNLIQNSIKYNGSNFDINITLEKNMDKITIIIEDTGIGIPKEYHDSIFEPMVRVESSRNRALGGTGLGLSITKHIIKKHGGNITLDPSYLDGCRFIITLS